MNSNNNLYCTSQRAESERTSCHCLFTSIDGNSSRNYLSVIKFIKSPYKNVKICTIHTSINWREQKFTAPLTEINTWLSSTRSADSSLQFLRVHLNTQIGNSGILLCGSLEWNDCVYTLIYGITEAIKWILISYFMLLNEGASGEVKMNASRDGAAVRPDISNALLKRHRILITINSIYWRLNSAAMFYGIFLLIWIHNLITNHNRNVCPYYFLHARVS